MQVNLTPNHSHQNFGMAIKTGPIEKTKVADYLSRKIVNIKDAVELNKYIETQRANPHDIYLSTTSQISREIDEKLCARVGGDEFVSANPLKAIRKAVKSANNFYEERLSFEARSNGISTVISKIFQK